MTFRKAKVQDISTIWEIILYAKESRRLDGSNQWQDGYPNKQQIAVDIAQGNGYVLCIHHEIIFYAAIIFDIEPAYEAIQGQWLTHQPYAVIHRMAVSPDGKRKGFSTKMMLEAEKLCLQKNIFSIKIDTNFDNAPMLYLIQKLGYKYCGKVYFRGSERKAYEKILIPEINERP